MNKEDPDPKMNKERASDVFSTASRSLTGSDTRTNSLQNLNNLLSKMKTSKSKRDRKVLKSEIETANHRILELQTAIEKLNNENFRLRSQHIKFLSDLQRKQTPSARPIQVPDSLPVPPPSQSKNPLREVPRLDSSRNPLDSLRNEISEIERLTEDTTSLIEKIVFSHLRIETKAEAILRIKNSPPGDVQKSVLWVKSLLRIPFGNYIQLPIDMQTNSKLEVSNFLKERYRILDSSVYNLKEPKTQIIDHLAKLIRNPSSKGNVIALQGPPGIGKTKLIKKGISEALGRPFYVINFGGIRDSTSLEGYDFTYVNSRYGRIVDCLIKAKCMNPVIYLDEIDKISETHFEEISGVLTHLLDEEQHYEFYDNYFQGIPIDLSKVLFVISFNDPTKISSIVNSRLKIISLDPPSDQDKIEIAKRFLLPEVISQTGLTPKDITISDDNIRLILKKTEFEEGIRKFKRNIQNVVEKANASNLLGDSACDIYNLKIEFPCEISPNEINKFVPGEKNSKELFYFN